MKRFFSQLLLGMMWLSGVIAAASYFVGMFMEYHHAMSALSVCICALSVTFVTSLWYAAIKD